MTDRSFTDQLADVWENLAGIGDGLSADEWALPTECPGWSVKDQYAHVVGTEAMLLGRPSPPAAPAAAHVRNPIGEFNEAWVAERRPRSGAEVVAELREVAAARLAALAAMTDDELAVVGPSPIGQVPYATFMSVRVMDCWVHEQDVRQTLGRPWRLAVPAAVAAVDRLTASLGYVVGKKAAAPDGSTVSVRITGPLQRTVNLAVAAGRATPAPAGAEPTAVVTTDGETYVRVATGRLDPATALASGQLRLDGDVELAGAVAANLAQMP